MRQSSSSQTRQALQLASKIIVAIIVTSLTFPASNGLQLTPHTRQPNWPAEAARSLQLASVTTLPPLLTSPQTTIATTTTSLQDPPEFEEPIGNYTVPVGREVQFSCRIRNLANFRTAWLRVEDKGILTIHNNLITRNYRIGLINKDEDGANFVLTIRNVQPADKGGYMCQINSVPAKYAIGYLDVLTPPTFDDINQAESQPADSEPLTTSSGSGVVIVAEGSSANLSCRARGHPTPSIIWKREDGEPILLDGAQPGRTLAHIEGSQLVLHRVGRLNSGAYLCIASNGVQPAASKRQLLDIQFGPILRLPATELAGQLGQRQAHLVCQVELNPLGSYHWVKVPPSANQHRQEGPTSPNEADAAQQQQQPNQQQQLTDDLTLIEHDELLDGDKYEIVIKQVNSEKVQMSLSIRMLEKRDFGHYKCIARNSLGLQSSSIRLYESPAAPAASSSSSSFPLNIFRGSNSIGSSDQQHQSDQQQNDQQQVEARTGKQASQSGQQQQQPPTRPQTRSSWLTNGRLGGKSDSPSSKALLNGSSGGSQCQLSLLILFVSLGFASWLSLSAQLELVGDWNVRAQRRRT